MASLAETKKSNSVLLGDIHKHLLDQHDKPTDRRQDIIHPSEMAKSDWCPRQTYYRLAGVSPEQGRRFSAQLEAIFEEGHGIHAKWQKWLQNMERLWGKWYCILCDRSWQGNAHDIAQPCWIEHGHAIEYREVPLEAEAEFLIAGHEDGAIEDLNALVEIKSIGIGTVRFDSPELLRQYTVKTEDGKTVTDLDGLWKSIRRPFPSHIRQTAVYLRLCKEMGLPFDKVIFLYEYKATQAHKEFVVKYNPEIAEPMFDTALDIKYALRKGKPPPRPDFCKQESKTCKECPFVSHCYKGEGNSPIQSKNGVSKEETLQAGTRVHRGEHADRPPRSESVSDVPAGEVREEGPATVLRKRARTDRGQHRSRRQRQTQGLPEMPRRDVGRVAGEEPRVRPEIQVSEEVRDHGRAVRLVARRATAKVSDMPS